MSIILTCYNSMAFARTAITCLLAQRDAEIEVVVVDDASTDGTREILTELAAADPRVRALLLPANGGVAAAREAAVAAATGDYVWFVDDDDEWPDDAAAALLAAAHRADADIVCAQAHVAADGVPLRSVGSLPAKDLLSGRDAFAALLVGQLTGHLWNKLFRRSLLARIDFTRIRQHSDQAMVAQAFAGAARVAILRRDVYTYRLRTGSIIRSGAQRAQSLRILGEVIGGCARRLDMEHSTAYLYYRARFGALSRMKDATSAAYPPEERSALVRSIRSEMSVAQWRALVRRRDAKRSALYALAAVSPRGFALLLDRAGGRL
ncbi:glycosyltransferase family 2 protein [Microbacterium aurum]